MRLGCIDYLNCYPFYFHMLEKRPLKGIKIFSGYPSMLNEMLAARQLDMSPVSSATCADISEEVVVLPEFCLSSVGYVGSVILISKVPIEDLDHRTVGLTSASHTSVVLLKVLLKKYFQVDPVYIEADPRPSLADMDAALIIGNDAMVNTPEPASYLYDLGDLWLRKTGFPVVFAVFVVREKIIEKYRSEIRAVVASYSRSLQCLEEVKEEVMLKAKERYPDIVYDMDRYYGRLKFEFTHELKRALMFYYSVSGELGLIKNITKLKYLAIDSKDES